LQETGFLGTAAPRAADLTMLLGIRGRALIAAGIMQNWISTIGNAGVQREAKASFYLTDNNRFMRPAKFGFRFAIDALYYYRGTPSSGSADPL